MLNSFGSFNDDEDFFFFFFSGWHICTTCQKDSFYMCYTCPYSVCKRCVRSSEYVVVRENKGFCGICMKTIMLIENAAEANKEKVCEYINILLLFLLLGVLNVICVNI